MLPDYYQAASNLSRRHSCNARDSLRHSTRVSFNLRPLHVAALRWPEGTTWLFVGLVLLTVVPSACVLWFMNEAVTIESAAARQRVLEAYRGQLRLVRSRLDGVWRTQATQIDGSGEPAQRFAQLVAGGGADGAVLLDDEGHVAYPQRDEPRDPAAADLERRIAAIEALGGEARTSAIDSIAGRVNDYSHAIPAASRLMLMDRLRALAPNVWLPTQAALRLSMDLLATERPTPVADIVRLTALADVWALTSADRRAIALYRTGRIEEMMHDALHEVSPAGIVFVAYPPDERADAEAIAAGPWLPGWQLSFVPLDSRRFADEARRRRAVYLAVATMGIGLIVLIGVGAGGGLRRHLRLARLKTDLVAAASHELRTPVASMRVLVDGLLADATLEPTKTREYLQLIAAESSRLSRQVDSFLTFSRLDRRRYHFELTPVPPSVLVDAALAAVRDRVPCAAAVQIDVAAALPPVRADVEMMTTAFTNLLDNALKYTPADKRISIVVRREPRSVAFALSDNGIGIATADRRRIFRRFYQVDQRLSRETGGVGLGLSIVALIVRGHRGHLSVESELGQGSTFVIRLPIAAEAQP